MFIVKCMQINTKIDICIAYIHTIVRFWCEGALQNKSQISEHGVLPLVYVQVRKQGS